MTHEAKRERKRKVRWATKCIQLHLCSRGAGERWSFAQDLVDILNKSSFNLPEQAKINK
jgi:hypothetical protein